MSRRGDISHHRQLTKSETQNLDRFGCAFRPRPGIFLVDWRGKGLERASNAQIFACLAQVGTKAGPITLLAFEISAVRPLPSYSYFPFNLRRRLHREYLSRFAQTGEIRLCFAGNKKILERTHQLTPYLRRRTSEIHAEISQGWSAYQNQEYDFAAALQLLENHVRIPYLMERIVLEDNFHDITPKIREAVHAVPKENRELASGIVRKAAEAFAPYYQKHDKTLLENLHSARLGLTCIIDFNRMFADNPNGLVEFLTDGLAATFSRKELEGLSELLKVAISVPKLLFREPSSPPTEPPPTIPELPAGLAALVQSMTASGIPKDAPGRFFRLIGLEVGGKRGRPPKDYSREYDLKASGLSWSKVARESLAEDADLRTELGERDYDQLDFTTQVKLKNRIREGVRSYASRMGKPFPPKSVTSQPVLAEQVQKSP